MNSSVYNKLLYKKWKYKVDENIALKFKE
jgi:hypothetical protein